MDALDPVARGYALGALARQQADETDFLVAEVDGTIVGSGELTTTEPAELKSLWVEPSARGHRVGSAIVRACEVLVVDRGVVGPDGRWRLVMGVGLDNPRAAVLYERLGFQRTGAISTTTYDYVDDEGVNRTATETDEELIKIW
ncbi:GNAT family N-acetyltransferase [Microcella sp.]|uniref:GNAT family N-acetyltransferase n=1 Tax=Microcella sp. TaxID=1913979 RepID=UPI0039195B54